MDALLLAVSVSVSVFYNVLLNSEGKRGGRKKGKEFYFFNLLLYGIGFLFLLLLAVGRDRSFSLFSLLFGVLFGCVTVLGSITKLHALANGPMHITVLIITSSMIIPSLSGILISGDTLHPGKLAAIAALLFFLYLSMNGSRTAVNRAWLVSVFVSFFSQGAVGVMQKLHQASPHAGESAGFLAASFFCSALFAGLMLLLPGKKSSLGNRMPQTETGKETIQSEKHDARFFVTAILCGVCIFVMNELNLLLAGRIPSILFFPIQNGAVLLLNALAAVFLFREPLTGRQKVGLCGGILSLVLLCIL